MLIAFIAATRVLTPTDVGTAALLAVVTGYAAVCSTLGFDIYGSSRLLPGKANEAVIFSEVTRIRGLLILPVVATASIFLLLVGRPPLGTALLFVLAMSVSVIAVVYNAGWVAVGVGRTWPVGVIRASVRVCALASVLLLQQCHALHLAEYILVVSAAQLAESALLLLCMHLRPALPAWSARRNMLVAGDYAGISIMGALYAGADHVILAIFAGAALLAPYAESYRIFWVLGGFSILLTDAAWKRLSDAGISTGLSGNKVLVALMLAAICAPFSALGGVWLTTSLYHSHATVLAAVLFSGLPFFALRAFAEKLLLIGGMPRRASGITALAFVVDALLNLILDPWLGSEGAALASSATEICLSIAALRWVCLATTAGSPAKAAARTDVRK
jgi:O-antigen/teichoic acid export membrane protein